MDDRLLVIGAGPIGLAVAKAFGEAGIPYVVAEATDHVGGNWAHGVYSTAHIISSRKTTEYTDWPMPSGYPDFPSAAQMCAYYEAYADQFGLRRNIRFSTPVASVRPVDGGWEVAFDGHPAERFRGVVVCNGHHWSKDLPAWTADFRGEVLHSKDYRHPDQLRGRRVLVLGGGNSGCDVVSEAARVSTSADWSLRRGYWFMPKTMLGRPSVELMSPWLPVAAQRVVIKSLLRVIVGDYRRYGLPLPDHDLFDHHPTVSTEVFHYLKHGRIHPRPDVVSADGHTVRFADGATGSYDLVVCATGFHLDLPMLAPGTVEVVGKCPQLIAGTMTRNDRHLYVVGGYQARYGLGPLVRPAAVLLARWVKLQDELAIPLGEALYGLGLRPLPSHLVDPHAALRNMRLATRLMPLIARRARARDRALARR
jgi:hypothetical protein